MTKYFNLPASNYEILCRIISACALFQDRLVFSKIAENCQFDLVVVLGNIGFLVSVGIVQGGMSKSLTANGKSLASAICINDPENIKECWNRIFSECAATRSIATHLEINKRTLKSILIHRIALALGVTLNPQNQSKMNQLLGVFEALEILRNEDGEYVFMNFEQKIIHFRSNNPSYSEESNWTRPTAGGSGRADFFDIVP